MRALFVNICMQSTLAVTLLAAKSEKLFQDAIMTEQGAQLGFDLLNCREKKTTLKSLRERWLVNLIKIKLTLIY